MQFLLYDLFSSHVDGIEESVITARVMHQRLPTFDLQLTSRGRQGLLKRSSSPVYTVAGHVSVYFIARHSDPQSSLFDLPPPLWT